MKLPKSVEKWLRGPDAPSPDLEAQRHAAQEALEAATRATVVAQDAFDATGTLETQAALTAAQDAERAAQQHVERAERLLAAAREREAAEQCTRELAEADDIAGRVCHAGLIAEATERAQRRLDLHIQLAELERDDAERRRELAALVASARAARARHDVTDSVDDHSHLIGSDIVMADLAEAHARSLPMGDPRRQYLTDLVHRLAPSQLRAARQSPREAQS